MYKRILVPLEHSHYDDVIIAHVRDLARLAGSSIVLIHVADGWAARNIKQLNLRGYHVESKMVIAAPPPDSDVAFYQQNQRFHDGLSKERAVQRKG